MQKASGLFAVLPPPKGTPLSNKSFIPNVLTKKVNKPTPPRQPKKIPIKPKPKQPETPAELESDDEDLGEMPETFDEETWQKVCAPQKRAPKRTVAQAQEEVAAYSYSVIEAAPEPQKPYDGLDNAAVCIVILILTYSFSIYQNEVCL